MSIRDVLDKHKDELPDFMVAEINELKKAYDKTLDTIDHGSTEELAVGSLIVGATALLAVASLSSYVATLLEKVDALEKQLKQQEPEF